MELPDLPRWTSEPPDLSREKRIGLDTETCDPQLLKLGPGARRDGRIVGVSVAVPDGGKWYLPFGHAEGNNLDEDKIKQWCKDNLCTEGQEKVGANLLYDLEYLHVWGVPVTGPYLDVQVAEPLIDENAHGYSLNSIAERYLGVGKTDDALYTYCARRFGGKAERKQAGNIWRCPPSIVRPYAEDDALLPLQIMEKQEAIIRDNNLSKIFDIETRLIPLLLAMRLRGVRIDMDRAAEIEEQLIARSHAAHEQIRRLNKGKPVNVWAAASIAEAFDNAGLDYPRTAKGAPSFRKAWLNDHPHVLAKYIAEVRQMEKLSGTFIHGHIYGHAIDGRIYAQFNQLRGDEYGTITGRLSSSNPNLQQIPARSDIGKLLRGVFVPEPGEEWWKLDYSQIEPRLLLHYANNMDPVANKLIELYRQDPTRDCYLTMMEYIHGVERQHIKTIYLGMTYGMGLTKMAGQLGLSMEDAEPLFEQFHEGAPYVKRLSRKAMARAEERGQIITLLGRRRLFNMWESANWDDREECIPSTDREAIIKQFGRAKRAHTYKALNALIQGSAADVMKMAMVDVWESGVCDVLGAPLLTVHDELDWSVPKTPEGREAASEVKNIMETCVDTHVKLVADAEVGPNWGEVK